MGNNPARDHGTTCAHPAIGAPDLTQPNTLASGGPAGGRTGAVLLSRLIAPGTVNSRDDNHYSLLRRIEDILRLAHLRLAAIPGLQTFGSDIFGAASHRPT